MFSKETGKGFPKMVLQNKQEESHIYRVCTSYACYAIGTTGEIITTAAPIIASWAIGKTIKDFTYWVKSKGGTVERII